MNAIPKVELPSEQLNSNELSIAAPIIVGEVKNVKAKLGPPRKGEHTHQILEEVGFTEEEIENFYKEEIVM